MGQLMQYRRAKTSGATYFFTVVTYQRQLLLHTPKTIDLLPSAFHNMKAKFPFTIDAIIVLADHLHCIWTLPEGDTDFSSRWRRLSGLHPLQSSQSRTKGRSH